MKELDRYCERKTKNCNIKQKDALRVCCFLSVIDDLLENEPEFIHWNDRGNVVIVEDKDHFKSNLLPMYFHHTSLQAFIDQLRSYGFSLGSSTVKKSRFYFKHDCFLRGESFYCECMIPNSNVGKCVRHIRHIKIIQTEAENANLNVIQKPPVEDIEQDETIADVSRILEMQNTILKHLKRRQASRLVRGGMDSSFEDASLFGNYAKKKRYSLNQTLANSSKVVVASKISSLLVQS